MVSTIPVRQGISSASVTAIPNQWDAQWFRRFITNHLVNSDVRNATAGTGITISGNLSTPATVSVGGGSITPTELAPITGPAVLGNPNTGTGNVATITAGSDGLVFQRSAGALTFGLVALSSVQTIAGQTVVGNSTGTTATPTALTTTQLTTLINQFTATLSGAVPASGGGTVNFLRADGTFTTPSKVTLQTSGWGTPTGAAVVSNFNGGSGTLAQATAAIAQIINDLKTLGLYGA